MANNIKLSELEPGTKARILRIEDKGAFNRRIRDMGLNPGAEIVLEKKAPLGDPLHIKVKTLSLVIRKNEAEKIFVEIL